MWGVSKCRASWNQCRVGEDTYWCHKPTWVISNFILHCYRYLIFAHRIEYSITGDVMQFALISWSEFLRRGKLSPRLVIAVQSFFHAYCWQYAFSIWNKILRYNIIGHNILSLSRNPPPLFEWVASKNIKSKRKLHLCFKGTNKLVGGFMFGQVFSCNLKSKVMGDSNFIKPRIRSSISIVPIETEWEHVTSMLSMVTGDVKLAFPTYSQGLVFGTIAVGTILFLVWLWPIIILFRFWMSQWCTFTCDWGSLFSEEGCVIQS